MLTELFPLALGGQDGERRGLVRDGSRSPSGLTNVIAEATASAAQWNFRIDGLIAHLDTVAETIDFLEDREVRIALRQALKEKRQALQQAGRALTLQVRTLSCFAVGGRET